MQNFADNLPKEVMRTRTSKLGQELKLPTMNIIGNIDDETIKQLEAMEEIYFSITEKLAIKDLEISLLKQSNELKAENPSDTEANNSKEAPPKPSKANDNASKTILPSTEKSVSEIEKLYANVSQVYLRDVGHSLTATYIGCGSKYIAKAQKKCFGIFMSHKGDTVFLQGTQLQDCVSQENPCAGDFIRITKIEQFRKAVDRSHAKAAKFQLDIIELAPNETGDNEL